MKKKPNHQINNVSRCLKQAKALFQWIRKPHHCDQGICLAFVALAGDQTTRILAYAIWRDRSLSKHLHRKTSSLEVNHSLDSGASHAQPC